MAWQIVAAISSSVAVIGVLVTAVAARSQAKTAKLEADRRADEEKKARTEEIAQLRSDHDNLAKSVGEVKTEVKANGDKIGQLTEGQGEIKGSLNTLLSFMRPVVAEGVFGKSADDPAGV